jgi:hypothetical protein
MKLLFNFIFIIFILSSCQNNSRGILKSSLNDSFKIITGVSPDKISITKTVDTSRINQKQIPKNIFKLDIDSSYYVFVDKQAEFQNGDITTFLNYFYNKLRIKIPDGYPGKEIVSFDVDWNGHVKNIKIMKNIGYKPLDDEIIKILHSSPKWVPAILNGKRVGQTFVVPVSTCYFF